MSESESRTVTHLVLHALSVHERAALGEQCGRVQVGRRGQQAARQPRQHAREQLKYRMGEANNNREWKKQEG